MTVTSLCLLGSFMYLPFLAENCSSGMQLTMNSDSKILCNSQMFTFLGLSIGPEISSSLVPINLMILKFGMYFVSKFHFYQSFNHY